MHSARSLVVVVSLLGLLSSCRLPGPAGPAPEPEGAVEIVIDGLEARALVSDADMAAAYYVIEAAGPQGALLSATSASPKIKIAAQASGDWTVTARAYSAADVLIAEGSKIVTILAGTTKTVTITVKPIAGQGALAVTIIWDAERYPTASVIAKLNLQGGGTLALALSGGGGTVTSFTSPVPTGKHSLVLKLMYGSVVLIKRTETVWIYNGATTSGTVELPVAAALDVGVSIEMAGPLEVSIGGIVDPLAVGAPMTLVGSVPGLSETVSFSWYLDGVAQGSGDRWTFDAAAAPGAHRVDLTAVTADGTRAGSASAGFHVTQ